MKIANGCVKSGCYLQATFVLLAMTYGLIPFALSQSVLDFEVLSPKPVVQLVNVEHLPSKNLEFTLRNITNKTILEICISAQRGSHERICQSGFSSETPLPGPGDTFKMDFDSSGFVSGSQSQTTPQNAVRVDAVIYTDGSHMGTKEALARIESRMFGNALETKRTADILSASSDGSIAGLDSVLPKIGSNLPSTSIEAAKLLNAVSLPGVSPSLVALQIQSHPQGLLEGMTTARSRVFHKINNQKAIAASSATGRQRAGIVTEARLHGLSDLAQKYQALSQLQIRYIIAFLGEANAH